MRMIWDIRTMTSETTHMYACNIHSHVNTNKLHKKNERSPVEMLNPCPRYPQNANWLPPSIHSSFSAHPTENICYIQKMAVDRGFNTASCAALQALSMVVSGKMQGQSHSALFTIMAHTPASTRAAFTWWTMTRHRWKSARLCCGAEAANYPGVEL